MLEAAGFLEGASAARVAAALAGAHAPQAFDGPGGEVRLAGLLGALEATA